MSKGNLSRRVAQRTGNGRKARHQRSRCLVPSPSWATQSLSVPGPCHRGPYTSEVITESQHRGQAQETVIEIRYQQLSEEHDLMLQHWVNWAMRRLPKTAPVERKDIFQTARLTLFRCVVNFNPSLGVKFTTYLFRCLSNNMGGLVSREARHHDKAPQYSNTLSEWTVDPGESDRVLFIGFPNHPRKIPHAKKTQF